MKLKRDPVGFVLEAGDHATKLHLLEFLELLDTQEARELILSLLENQMSNGGFPSRFNERIAGVTKTCRTALLLLRCGIPQDGLNIQSAVNFLLKLQREDGGWGENPELTIPKEAIEFCTEESVTWLTGDIIELLREVGLEKREACKRALSWLRRVRNEEGGWFMFEGAGVEGSDPDSTAQITVLMRNIYGEDDPVYLKGKKLFESSLDDVARDAERGYYTALNGEKRENDIYHLTHLLLSSLVDKNSRIEADYDLNDKRVQKIVKAIVDSQLEDGGWRPFWSDNSDPVYTVLTLKLLASLGAVKVGDLRASVLGAFGKQIAERVEVKLIKEEESSDAREAVICFQFSERIKSEMIIASRLLGEIDELKGDELAGGKKMLLSFLEALLGEINLANNILKQQNITRAGVKVKDALERVRSDEYSEAIRRVSEAISHITTSGGRAMQILKQRGFL
jgi:hypothetical protein